MYVDTLKKIARGVLAYAIPYFGGIHAAIIFTPADLSLAGVPIWFLYPIFAIPAFFLVWTLFNVYSVLDYIVVGLYFVSIGCIVFGVASHFGSLRRYVHLSPKIIGFTFGFVGTYSVYFIASASI